MLESLEQFIRDHDLIPPGSTVLCAVSGGADSICLLHALYHLRGRLGFSLAAAHYNHQLRGWASDQDAAFVAQFVRLYCGEDVPFFSGSGDVQAQAEARGAGIEETAREMRYAFLSQAAKQAGADYIATAHNADDNVETILFHLARGSGLRGLTGIPPKRDGLIRPLLSTPRRDIEAYLAHHCLSWVQDESNLDDTYTRNRIRHQVAPVLEDICPGLALRLADTAALLRADEALLSQQAQALSGQAELAEERLTLPASVIGDAPDPLATRAVRQLIGTLNGGDQDCGSIHLHDVVRLCRSSDPSAQIHLPYGLIARREYDRLVLTKEGPMPIPKEALLPTPGKINAGYWRILCTAESYAGQPQGPYDFWLDRQSALMLTLRPRRTGDWLRLPNRPHKTVKKWCIDEKIPAHLRPALPVLLCQDRVAAVVGLGPDQSFLPGLGQEAWHITVSTISSAP